MKSGLTKLEIQTYRDQGFLFPVPVLSPAEIAKLVPRFDVLEQHGDGLPSPTRNQKPHLLIKWLNDLIRHPRILDPVESILGPNILCWSSSFFVKNAHHPARVSWHQDSTYWGLSKPDVVTAAWLAFTPSTVENGCMRVIPETHTSDQLPHNDTFAKNNLLTRGQEIAVDVDPAKAVNIELCAGEMSLHHVGLIHGSEPNRSASRRIGFAIRYIPTYVQQVAGIRDSATLVRGTDEFGHFSLEPTPEADFHPDEVKFHADVTGKLNQVLYRKL